MKPYRLKIGRLGSAIIDCYYDIEYTVVRTYKKIEHGVVGQYKKIEDAFVQAFLEPTDKL